MNDTTAHTSAIYEAIAAFQRTHRLPGLQHAQIRGLLAEHLARVLPAAAAGSVPAADRATLRDFLWRLEQSAGDAAAEKFLDDNPELRRVADETPQPETEAHPAATLSPIERRMLEYALNLADAEIEHDGHGINDEEQDALADLRRLVSEPQLPTNATARCGQDIEAALGTYPCERDAGHRGDCDERTEAEIKGQSTVVPQPEIVHGCPPDGSGLTPCCGRTPFELPRTDRISSEEPVTCPGPAAPAQPGKEA